MNVTFVPAQIAPAGLAATVTDGVTDVFTTTDVVPIALTQPLTVTVTLYVPDIARVADGRVGFCNADVNPHGPVQEYVAPATVGVDNMIV